MILAEIDAIIDPLGTLKTFYVSNGSYATEPSDTPGSVAFTNALDDPGDITRSVYGSTRAGGTGDLDIGALSLKNDGRFDSWINYGWDGQRILLRRYVKGLPYASMPILYSGTTDGPPQVDRKKVTMRLRDLQQVLEVPVCTNPYRGDNALPAGIEGTANDIKGKMKPRLFGTVYQVPADCVNTDVEVYRVNDGAVYDIAAVYDKGSPLTRGSDYATSALLLAAPYTPGYYQTCLAEGLFKLSATPQGVLTADVIEGSTVASRTVAQVTKRLCALAGVTLFEETSFTALDTEVPAQVGIHINDNSTVRSAINQVLQSVGAFAIFNNDGAMKVGRLHEPTATPVLTITNSRVKELERITPADGDRPLWRATTNYCKLYTQHTLATLAGSLTAARKAYLTRERRSAQPASNAAIKTQYRLADDYQLDTLLINEADARTQALRDFDLYSRHRDMYEVTIDASVLGTTQLNDVVSVQYPRYGLDDGKLFVVLGVSLQLYTNDVVLTIWG
jgi:hypothetical protein